MLDIPDVAELLLEGLDIALCLADRLARLGKAGMLQRTGDEVAAEEVDEAPAACLCKVAPGLPEALERTLSCLACLSAFLFIRRDHVLSFFVHHASPSCLSGSKLYPACSFSYTPDMKQGGP